MNCSFFLPGILIVVLCMAPSPYLTEPPDWNFGSQLEAYFVSETNKLTDASYEELSNTTDWDLYQNQNRWKLMHMLGLDVFALEREKTPLNPVITGELEEEDFRVEKLHFQSLPGLYVTANLYLPKQVEEPLPAILYVCGHGKVKEDGISYGNKTHYQHHAAWFARNGYVCLIIDTNQLGEIEGVHHGTHHLNRWWWISRGYTPAGVEAWNGVRAVDYLISRSEVDANRIGMTGRSGGGAYTWWGAAIDQRIKVAVPVAGITDMRNHIIDQCVDGHCDCMFMVNTFRWDYPKLVPLVAPRPLLISNTDRDPIFPLDGVYRSHRQGRFAYSRMNASDRLALHITAGPHHDTQELRIHAFRWFNQHLKESDALIDIPATKFFEPKQLKVFDQLPKDEINTSIDQTFVKTADPVQKQLENFTWAQQKQHWKQMLDERIFASWPPLASGLQPELIKRYRNSLATFNEWKVKVDAEHIELPYFQMISSSNNKKARKIVILDDANWEWWGPKLKALYPTGEFWKDFLAEEDTEKVVKKLLKEYGEINFICMRGAGPSSYTTDEKRLTKILRRYYLLGQTLEVMQTFDIAQMLRLADNTLGDKTLVAEASGITAGQLAYASLYYPGEIQLQLTDPPSNHETGPCYPAIMRYMDMPIAVLMAAEEHALHIQSTDEEQSPQWKTLSQFAADSLSISMEVNP